MNRKHIAAIAVMAATAFSATAKEPVVMTVNGVDVPRSEFEYLYHKNQQQQVDPQTLDEYAEMFKIYKLKVADALSQRLDTLPAFRAEMKQYRADLATPYMTDSLYLNSLVKEAYDLSRQEAEAIHIMLLKGGTEEESKLSRAKADSLHAELLNGADFAELAAQYSVDRASSNAGGRMGYIVAGRFPYDFEKAAFTLAPGQISEVVESPQGWHILKGGNKRPARGTVLVEHIMKMVPPTSTAEQQAAAKASIDSIYNAVVANPDIFEDLARQLSDDKGSGRQGGKLNWFGAGMMVEPFDSAAFAIQVNEISRPVRSQYGWHVIRKLDAKGPASLEEMKPGILKRIANPQDERYALVEKNLIDGLRKKHKKTIGKRDLDDDAVKEIEYEWLYANEPDYRNLLNEYREGSLLYEASLREVWDKAAKDEQGLNDYFEAHRADYKWTKPHVKGILVQAANDSVADLVRTALKEADTDDAVKAVRKQFVGKAAIDRILMEEGQNAMVDNAVFNGAPVQPNNKKYTVYFVYEPKMLTAPETMTDVRSLVTGDYQNQLERDWVERLKSRYPVTVNEKVLRKVK
ncbi:MAG: peptidyl-prolyl cis-trans isomerase [Muribaculaceae bacterium]|nr:peptidyl-prolyl cis-trans isomerase [Muribaculaceae bacterium]